jgi:hypothetical protein
MPDRLKNSDSNERSFQRGKFGWRPESPRRHPLLIIWIHRDSPPKLSVFGFFLVCWRLLLMFAPDVISADHRVQNAATKFKWYSQILPARRNENLIIHCHHFILIWQKIGADILYTKMFYILEHHRWCCFLTLMYNSDYTLWIDKCWQVHQCNQACCITASHWKNSSG